VLTAESFEYQTPDGADHLWVETLLFPVVVPEAHLYALVYTNVRPTLGVMWNQVMVCGTLTEDRAELLHYAENPHLPAPERLGHIDSPLGLEIRAVDPPRSFRIDYAAPDGTEVHVDWVGLMEPFDIHDPAHSPQAGDAYDIHSDLEPGEKQPFGHGDMTGRITGTITVGGREFGVDSVERMDRSWGVRDPMKAGKANHIVSATFGEDLAFHMICPWNPDLGDDAFTLTHGYVLDDGEVFGLTDELTMVSRHLGTVCTGIDMTVTDVRGRSYDLHAQADVGAPWIAAPTALVHNAMMRWRHAGRPGYGVVMSTRFLPDLNRRHGKFLVEQQALPVLPTSSRSPR
jgi:hypothetical protein